MHIEIMLIGAAALLLMKDIPAAQAPPGPITADNPNTTAINAGQISDAPNDPQGWFIMPDGYLYRVIREESLDPTTGATNITLYERQGDTDHVYMLDQSGTHMLGMQP